MRLRDVRAIYDSEGPFATVYISGRSPAEDAEQQVRLGWNELRGQLASEGADETILDSLDKAVIADDFGEARADGRILVANRSGVLLNEAWDAALGAGDAAHFSDQPELGAYVRERARAVRILLAVADQRGAVIRRVVAAEQHSLDERGERNVRAASDESVHKPRKGALSHKQIQHRADEAVKQNAREVAEYLDRIAGEWHPDVVVLAGEVQGRSALRDELSESLVQLYREADSGGLGDEGAEEALTEQLQTIAAEVSEDRAQQLTERFQEARAHDRAAEGAAPVARAAEMGAVETLLFEHDRSAPDEAALLAASSRIDADVGLVTSEVDDAVAAVLRFEAPDEINR